MIGLGTEGTAGMVPILAQPAIPNGEADQPLVRFTGELLIRDWSVSRPSGNPLISHLTVTITTGVDDLRGGNNRAWARVGLPTGIYEVDLSGGANWPKDSVRTVSVALPAGTHANDILSFGLRTAGTDLNGFAPQIPFTASPVSYPLTIASKIGNARAPALPRAQMGTRTFDFHTDGIAHYGMLSDFMQALDDLPDSDEPLEALFHSAGDVIQMWEACEAAAVNIP